MTVIIIITIVSLILYKIGWIKNLLRAATLAEDPRPQKMAQIKVKSRSQAAPQISEREQLEVQAAAVVAAMGGDARTVVYMGESLLRALINDYTKEHTRK